MSETPRETMIRVLSELDRPETDANWELPEFLKKFLDALERLALRFFPDLTLPHRLLAVLFFICIGAGVLFALYRLSRYLMPPGPSLPETSGGKPMAAEGVRKRAAVEEYRKRAAEMAGRGDFSRAAALLHRGTVIYLKGIIGEDGYLTNREIARILERDPADSGLASPFGEIARLSERILFKGEAAGEKEYLASLELYENHFLKEARR